MPSYLANRTIDGGSITTNSSSSSGTSVTVNGETNETSSSTSNNQTITYEEVEDETLHWFTVANDTQVQCCDYYEVGVGY